MKQEVSGSTPVKARVPFCSINASYLSFVCLGAHIRLVLAKRFPQRAPQALLSRVGLDRSVSQQSSASSSSFSSSSSPPSSSSSSSSSPSSSSSSSSSSLSSSSSSSSPWHRVRRSEVPRYSLNCCIPSVFRAEQRSHIYMSEKPHTQVCPCSWKCSHVLARNRKLKN